MGEMRDRLDFFIERYGEEKAMQWAEMALAAYLEALIANGPYKEQVEELQRFINEDGTIVKLVVCIPPPPLEE